VAFVRAFCPPSRRAPRWCDFYYAEDAQGLCGRKTVEVECAVRTGRAARAAAYEYIPPRVTMTINSRMPASMEVDSERLADGGDIRAAYSGEIIMTTPPTSVAEIPEPFLEQGTPYTTTSIILGVGGTAYELRPVAGEEDEADADRPRDSYDRRLVRHGAQLYRLSGPPKRLMKAEEAANETPTVEPTASAAPAAAAPPAHVAREPESAAPEEPQPDAASHAATASPSAAPDRDDSVTSEAPGGEAAGVVVPVSESEAAEPHPVEAEEDDSSEAESPDEQAEEFPEVDAAAAAAPAHGSEEEAAPEGTPAKPAAAAPDPPPPEPSFEWEKALIRVVLTFRAADGAEGGRPVLIAVQNNSDLPLFSSTRLETLGVLPPPIAEALERLKADMPAREAAYAAKREAEKQSAAAKAERDLAQRMKSGSRAKKSAARTTTVAPTRQAAPTAPPAGAAPPDATQAENFEDVDVVSDDSSPSPAEAETPQPARPAAAPARASKPQEPSSQASLFG
jgi:hypothetical protein